MAGHDEIAQRKAKARGRARLKALGIDVDTLTHEQIREAYEAYRAAYIDAAEAGRHMEPVRIDGDPLSGACAHARYGQLVDALRDWGGRPSRRLVGAADPVAHAPTTCRRNARPVATPQGHPHAQAREARRDPLHGRLAHHQ